MVEKPAAALRVAMIDHEPAPSSSNDPAPAGSAPSELAVPSRTMVTSSAGSLSVNDTTPADSLAPDAYGDQFTRASGCARASCGDDGVQAARRPQAPPVSGSWAREQANQSLRSSPDCPARHRSRWRPAASG